MGVSGLLPALSATAQTVAFPDVAAGAAVGVDLSGWLHEICANHYRSVVLAKDHRPVVHDVVERARTYVMAGVRPVFVADGRKLPGKAGTDDQRMRRRLQNQALVEAALDDVDMTELQAAIDSGGELPVDIEERTLKAAISVGDALVTDTIRALRTAGFFCKKAPYEADAQLAAFDRLDVTQYTETVDSDLIVYGVRKVLTKVKHGARTATLFDTTRWQQETEATRHVPLLKLLRKWKTNDALIWFACLSGCDYVHLPGFGPSVALKILEGVRNTDHLRLTVEMLEAVAKRLEKKKHLHGAKVPADFCELLTDAAMVYTSQVVYDPTHKADTTLGSIGEERYHPCPWQPPSQCGALATGDVTVTVGDEQVQMTEAEAHSQGFLETRGGGRNLVALPVTDKFVMEGAAVPSFLTKDMVQGSELDEALVSDAAIAAGSRVNGAIGKAALKQFLLTRGYDHLSQDTWEAMAKKAQRQLALERDLASKAAAEGQDPPPLMLRDHTGGCCDGYLLERGLLTLEQCPQGDGALTAPPSTDGGWVTDMRVLSNIAPAISEQTILNFYAPLGAKEDASVRVLERGYAHIEGLRVLQDYAYHPAPIPGRPNVVCTRMMIRASFKATSYCTVVWYQIDTQSTCTIKPVLKVLRVLCAPAKEGGDYCRASAASHDMKYAFCTHGSANIQVLRNLPRADNVAIPDDLRSRTSQLQAWSNPGMGETHDIGMPIWQCVLSAPDRLRHGPRRLCACLSTTTRARWIPCPPDQRHRNDRASEARSEARLALFDQLNCDFARQSHSGRRLDSAGWRRSGNLSDEDWSEGEEETEEDEVAWLGAWGGSVPPQPMSIGPISDGEESDVSLDSEEEEEEDEGQAAAVAQPPVRGMRRRRSPSPIRPRVTRSRVR